MWRGVLVQMEIHVEHAPALRRTPTRGCPSKTARSRPRTSADVGLREPRIVDEGRATRRDHGQAAVEGSLGSGAMPRRQGQRRAGRGRRRVRRGMSRQYSRGRQEPHLLLTRSRRRDAGTSAARGDVGGSPKGFGVRAGAAGVGRQRPVVEAGRADGVGGASDEAAFWRQRAGI